MVEKKKRGRPRLEITDAERTARQRMSRGKWAEKTRSFALPKALAARFEAAKEEQEKKLGFNLTYGQFVTILLTRWENDES
jgi:hypothetical protein